MSSNRIFVGNFPNNYQRRHFEDLFDRYGRINDIEIVKPRASMDRSCFITFKRSRDGEWAIEEMDRKRVENCVLRVEVAHGGGRSRFSDPQRRRSRSPARREPSRRTYRSRSRSRRERPPRRSRSPSRRTYRSRSRSRKGRGSRKEVDRPTDVGAEEQHKAAASAGISGRPPSQAPTSTPTVQPSGGSHELYEISLSEPYLPRTALINRLDELLFARKNRVVVIDAPPASGKTLLLEIYQQHLRSKGKVSVLVPFFGANSAQERLLECAKIDVANEKVLIDSPCADPQRDAVVMLDDAQLCFGDAEKGAERNAADQAFWCGLLRTDTGSQRWLPRNIHFIISTTYPLQTHTSCPLSFSFLPKLNGSDLVLSEDESRQFVSIQADKLSPYVEAHPIRAVLRTPAIVDEIAQRCGGLVGSLQLMCTYITMRFSTTKYLSSRVTLESRVREYYLTLLEPFLRCFPVNLQVLPEELVQALQGILTGSEVIASDVPEPARSAYQQLKRAGVIREAPELAPLRARDQDMPVQFTSPIAALYINKLIYPGRYINDLIADLP